MVYLRCPSCYYSFNFKQSALDSASCAQCDVDLRQHYFEGRDSEDAKAFIRVENARLKKLKDEKAVLERAEAMSGRGFTVQGSVLRGLWSRLVGGVVATAGLALLLLGLGEGVPIIRGFDGAYLLSLLSVRPFSEMSRSQISEYLSGEWVVTDLKELFPPGHGRKVMFHLYADGKYAVSESNQAYADAQGVYGYALTASGEYFLDRGEYSDTGSAYWTFSVDSRWGELTLVLDDKAGLVLLEEERIAEFIGPKVGSAPRHRVAVRISR